MHMNFKNWSLVILLITAFACSRIIFALINDPEGPNLLVVSVMAAVLFLISAAIYLSKFYPSLTGFKRSSAAVVVQIVVAICFYLGLR
jgi:hypothetical protein